MITKIANSLFDFIDKIDLNLRFFAIDMNAARKSMNIKVVDLLGDFSAATPWLVIRAEGIRACIEECGPPMMAKGATVGPNYKVTINSDGSNPAFKELQQTEFFFTRLENAKLFNNISMAQGNIFYIGRNDKGYKDRIYQISIESDINRLSIAAIAPRSKKICDVDIVKYYGRKYDQPILRKS